MLSSNKEEFERILFKSLKKVYREYIFIGEEVPLRDAENRYFSIESGNREKLIKFIDELPSCKILPDQVVSIVINDSIDKMREEFEIFKKQVESTNKPNQPGFISSVMKQVINFGSIFTHFQYRDPKLADRSRLGIQRTENEEEDPGPEVTIDVGQPEIQPTENEEKYSEIVVPTNVGQPGIQPTENKEKYSEIVVPTNVSQPGIQAAGNKRKETIEDREFSFFIEVDQSQENYIGHKQNPGRMEQYVEQYVGEFVSRLKAATPSLPTSTVKEN